MEVIFCSMQPNELKQLITDAILQAIDNQPNPQQTEKEDQLIKLAEVAQMLKVSKVTIHTWKRKGLIPFYRISNKIYFKKGEVLSALRKVKSLKQFSQGE